jgi:hypothetical protein
MDNWYSKGLKKKKITALKKSHICGETLCLVERFVEIFFTIPYQFTGCGKSTFRRLANSS